MSSSDSFYPRSMVAWLETVISTGRNIHIPEDMPISDPLTHLCPLIVEYLGPNPYYCIPDTSNLQIREKIKQSANEKDATFEVYDAFFYEMRDSNVPIIPTIYPQFDQVLQPALLAEFGELPPQFNLDHNPQQLYIQSLFKQYHKFSGKYLQRYLPPLQQNQISTYSITNITILYDQSLLICNENNIFLWPSRYMPPSTPRPSNTDHHNNNSNNDDNINLITNQQQRQQSLCPHKQYLAQQLSLDELLQQPHLGDLYTAPFESVYNADTIETIKRCGKTTSIRANKLQTTTNAHNIQSFTNHIMVTNNHYKRHRIAKLFPQLFPSPFLYHSFDLKLNQYNSDIMLDRLPHELSKRKLLSLRKKRQHGGDSHFALELEEMVLFDEDLAFINEDDDPDDDFKRNHKGKMANSSSDDSGDEDDEDDDDNSDSGLSFDSTDDDSEEDSSDDSDDDEDKKAKKRQQRREDGVLPPCPAGHTLYTAITPIPPLFHIPPHQDQLLRNYGISMHSTRLFLTGCNHGHIVLHDGLTGYCKVIGESKFPIAQLSIIHTHQHYSNLTQEDFDGMLNNVRNMKQMEQIRLDGVTTATATTATTTTPSTMNNNSPTTTATNQTTNITNINNNVHVIPSEALYHPNTRVFPLVVSLDQCGTVMFWDAITASLLAVYVQSNNDEPEVNNNNDNNKSGNNQKNGKFQGANSIYNYTGILKMSMCAIPLLPFIQRRERFGVQTIRPPAKTLYSSQQSSVLAMIFNRFEQNGLDLKTGLPNPNSKPNSPPMAVNMNPPQFDNGKQPWSPYINFPFDCASPKLNAGSLVDLANPASRFYTHPYIDPKTRAVLPPQPQMDHQINGLDLLTPTRGTFTAPTIIVTPYRNGQLTFNDLHNANFPTFFTLAHKQHITSIAYIGGLIWTAGWDCSIKSWDLRYLSTPVHTIEYAKKHITALAGLDDRYLIVATAEKEMKIFDIEQLAINRTYSTQVLIDCDEYINSIDFQPFLQAMQQNDAIAHEVRDFMMHYAQKKSAVLQQQEATVNNKNNNKNNHKNNHKNKNAMTDTPPITSPTTTATISPRQQQQLDKLDQELRDGLSKLPKPKTITDMLALSPFSTSPYIPLTLYPNFTHTQLFQQWLISHNLTYSCGQITPLVSSFDLKTNTLVTNMFTQARNNDRYVPIARSHAQRSEHSVNACIFDWDVDELIQNIVTLDGVIMTTSKECKSKVGVNQFGGNITPWVTSVSMDDFGPW